MSEIKEVQQEKGGILNEISTMLKQNIRDYMMYIVLVLIVIFFSWKTDGNFIKPGNISNLINQTGYVAVLAVGMTLILIIKHIDLSVGFVAGFMGAVAALMMSKTGLSEWVIIPIILVIGALIGVYQGFLVSRVGVPAFVTTLAGMFIFRGLLSLTLQSTGTVVVDETKHAGFNFLSSGYLPNIGNGSLHIPTLIIAAVAIIFIVVSQVKSRNNMLKYNFKVMSMPIFMIKMIFISGVVFVILYVLATDKGIPFQAIIVGAVVLIYNFMLNKTRLGRYIYAIGGNTEAAELSGVNVKNVTFFCFINMSMLAALSGILYTSRLKSAAPAAGVGFELDAIASSYIGGVAVSGGIGKVPNTIIGAFVIMSLTSGLNLMAVDISYQYIVKGAIFIIAVAFDITSRKKGR